MKIVVLFLICMLPQYAFSHKVFPTSVSKYEVLEQYSNKPVGQYSVFEIVNEQQGLVQMGVNIASLKSGNARFNLNIKELRGMAPLSYLKNWIVELPFIQISANAIGHLETDDICKTPVPAELSNFKTPSGKTRSFPASRYTDQFEGGDQPKVNIPGVYSGYLRKAGSTRNGFPEGAEFGLDDYSTVTCISTPNTSGKLSGFLLTRPDGTQYTFDIIDIALGDIWGAGNLLITVFM